MPEFTYKAVDTKNKEVKGTCQAINLQEADGAVRQMGLYPVQITKKVEKKRFLSLSKKIKKRDILSFTIQLQLMLSAGLPILRAFNNIAAQENNPKFRNIILDIAKRIEAKGSLGESISAYPQVFPPFYIGSIRAGESGGHLTEILEELVVSIEKQEELESSLKQAMIYPMLIMCVMSGVAGFYAFYLMPKLMELVKELGAPLPLLTRVIMAGTGLVRGMWLPFILLFIVGVIGLFIYSRTESGKYSLSFVKLKFPLFGPVVQKTVLAKFSHYLSLLLRTGFGLLPSLDLVKGTIGNASIVRAIETIQERVTRGESLSDSMRGLPFPPFMVSMVALGEENGTVDQQLLKVNEYFEKDVERATKRVLTMLEPLILIGFGGFAALILLSTFMPLYKAIGTIK
jgi:type IV pilus assembly protein PilC